MVWESWDQKLKTIVVLVIIVLAILLVVSTIIYIKSHFDYKKTCVPSEKYNKCEADLNSTQLKVDEQKSKIIELESKKDKLINESSECKNELDKCKQDLASISEQYKLLLNELNKLNQTYQILLEDYNKEKERLKVCNESPVSLEEEKECEEKVVYLKNPLIAVLSITLFLSIPFNIGFGDPLARRVLNFFMGAFIASMFLFGYTPISNFWIKFSCSIFVGIVVGIIVYKCSDKG